MRLQQVTAVFDGMRLASHLGHVFEGEGYPTPTDQRYCINSISSRLAPKE